MNTEAFNSIKQDPETSNDDFETDFQCELNDILNYESEPSEPDDDNENALVIDEDCQLYQEDTENIDHEQHDLGIADANVTSLFRYRDKNVLRLTAEEEDIITKCTDPALQRCLIQNRLKMAQLRDLFTKLEAVQNKYFLSKECENMKKDERSKSPVILPPKTYVWKIGTPFFKDPNSYGAPPNTDYINKQRDNEFTLAHISDGRRWVDEDQMMLRNSVDSDYYMHSVFELEEKMQNIKEQIENEHDICRKSELETELVDLQKELEDLKAGPSYKTPPYGRNDVIDWFKISHQQLKGLHTINECKAMWNIYLHPLVNKTDWTEEENKQIKTISEKYKYQNWDAIAKELGTNRSGYLICVHYYTKLCEKFRKDRFLPSEDDFLREVIANCRLGSYIPWNTVANYFEDRSKHQLYHRYRYYLSYENKIKKGLFSEAEDVLLAYLVNRFGKEYSKFAGYMPQRTTIQLRNRYSTYLEHITVNLGNFTVADDERILKYVETHGDKKWTGLASQLKRTRAHVRQRYLTLKKWLKKGPDVTLEQIPRRKQQVLLKYQSVKQQRMHEILKKLQDFDKIPTLEEIEKILTKKIENDAEVPKKWCVYTKKPKLLIDQKLQDYMKSIYKIRRETKTPGEASARASAQRTLRVVDSLGFDVNILKDCEITDESEEFMTVTRNEKKVFHSIKQLLNEGFQCDTGGSSNAGPSTSTGNLVNLDQTPKNTFPPTIPTLVALRGLLVRYEMYKEETNDNCVSRVKLDSTKTALEDPLIWQIEQNLLKLGVETRTKIVSERDLLFDRVCALFKWPAIMSTYFAEQLEKEETVEDPPKQNDIQIVPSPVGRPRKKINEKILKMNEAKKRKRADDVNANTSTASATTTSATTTTTVSPTTSTATTEEQSVVKKKRGRKAVKPIADYAIRYVPLRAKNKKIVEGEVIDLDDVEDVDDVEEVSIPNKVTKKVIIIDNIKLPQENVPLVDKNLILTLDKPNASKQVLVLNSAAKEPEGVMMPPQKLIRVYQNKKKIIPQKASDQPES